MGCCRGQKKGQAMLMTWHASSPNVLPSLTELESLSPGTKHNDGLSGFQGGAAILKALHSC